MEDGTLLLSTTPEKDANSDVFHIEIEYDNTFSYSKCYEHEVLPFTPSKEVVDKMSFLAIVLKASSIFSDTKICKRFFYNILGYINTNMSKKDKAFLYEIVDKAMEQNNSF